jgi:hypothetical protein
MRITTGRSSGSYVRTVNVEAHVASCQPIDFGCKHSFKMGELVALRCQVLAPGDEYSPIVGIENSLAGAVA